VDPTAYQAPIFGRAARSPGNRWAFWHFEPTTIVRDLPLDPATVLALSGADAAVGHLQGLGQVISDPQLLVGPYVTREALASSRIEGTQASLAEVLQAEAGAEDAAAASEDVAEVEAYVAATFRGLELIKTLPLTQRLVLDVHRVLLTGVRGQDRLPGELRRSPVWVGSPTDSPDTAVFVPPLPEQLGDLLADWERFSNEPAPMPVLVRYALMHYQFDTIHPFLDGNGRIGRLLIGLLLHQKGRVTTPLLYLSGYLETHRRQYYERLQAVPERGRSSSGCSSSSQRRSDRPRTVWTAQASWRGCGRGTSPTPRVLAPALARLWRCCSPTRSSPCDASRGHSASPIKPAPHP